MVTNTKAFSLRGIPYKIARKALLKNLYDEFSHIQHATTLKNANSIFRYEEQLVSFPIAFYKFREDCLKTNHVTDKSICSRNYDMVRKAGKECMLQCVLFCKKGI